MFVFICLHLGINPTINKIKDLYYSRYWSKPFQGEKHAWRGLYRYNIKSFDLQHYDQGSWEPSSWLYGTPVDVSCRVSDFDFNPYDWFENPLKPTLDEVTLWELEFGFEFKKIKKEVIKICKGGN